MSHQHQHQHYHGEKPPFQGQQPYPGQPPYQGQPHYQVQPQAIPPMTIGNRNPKNLPVNGQGKRGWSHGLCDCCGDCGTCCYACWCPCSVYSKTKRRLEYLNVNGRPDPSGGGSGCDGDCCLYFFISSCCGLGCLLQMSARGAIRNRYNIDGGCCSDFCAAAFCPLCDLVQGSREVDAEERVLHH